ncbi:MAG: hypothetical protein COA62_13165 [Rhodobiaceae bacterium]|nr:MAG: hypothetical protein COA62_13165 [Rhodobiaceae bacterium]
MSADPQTSPDQAVRAIAFLLTLLLVLVLATYLFGAGALLVAALVGTFAMLGVLIYLSSPNQRF